ncbi:MAG: radical SAM/SPASM domain-containing protein [Tissierellales bacterium]
MLNKDKDFIEERLLSRVPEYNTKFPSTILIDTISFCNLRCSMCFHHSMKRKKGIMEMDLFKKIIDEVAVKRPNAKIWITFFGEGLMLKDLPQKVKYAKDCGLTDVLLNSNGNLLKNEFSKQLIISGLDAIYVGIDAFKKDTYEKFRVGGNLEKVVKGVLEYKELLSKYGNSKQKIFVQFVEMEENKKELDDFVSFWNGHEVPVKIRPMVSWGGKVEANYVADGIDRIPCFWAMNTINISDNGKVCLCSVDLDCEENMGDINTQSIEEVWNSTLLEFRRNHIERLWDNLPNMCQNCKDWISGYAEYKG